MTREHTAMTASWSSHVHRCTACGRREDCGGMSLRAYYAGQALVGYLAATLPLPDQSHGENFPNDNHLADWCVGTADALIALLKETP